MSVEEQDEEALNCYCFLLIVLVRCNYVTTLLGEKLKFSILMQVTGQDILGVETSGIDNRDCSSSYVQKICRNLLWCCRDRKKKKVPSKIQPSKYLDSG